MRRMILIALVAATLSTPGWSWLSSFWEMIEQGGSLGPDGYTESGDKGGSLDPDG